MTARMSAQLQAIINTALGIAMLAASKHIAEQDKHIA